MTDFTYLDIAKMIDHSLLQPTLTDDDLDRGCRLAREYDVASVCIKPYAVRRAAELLAGSAVAVGTTIGFPHGGHVTAIKVAEARQAAADGARELDMVVNIGKVLSGDWRYVADDVRAVVEAAHSDGTLVKVIFENCFLNDAQKERLCRNLRRGRRGLREDLDGLRRRRGHGRRSAADAPLFAAAGSGQGGGRRADAGPAAGGAGAGRDARRGHGDEGHPRRMQGPAQ